MHWLCFRFGLFTFILIAAHLGASSCFAQSTEPAAAGNKPQLPSFAVEITVGSNWDFSKPAPEQAYFREHSANLKRLRDTGHLVLGARYSDKGLIILAAENEAAVQAMMAQDPAIEAGTFQYAVYPFHVFYGGTVDTRARPPAKP